MDTAISRKQTSFRLSEDLIENLRVEAKKHNQSLNRLVENILTAFVAEKPNRTTLSAIADAQNDCDLEALDLNDFHRFVQSL